MSRIASSALTLFALSGCAALPGAGPLASQIDRVEVPGELEGLVAPLTAEAAALAAEPALPGFPVGFLAASEVDPEQLGVGDVLDVTIWESGSAGVFSGAGGAAALPGVPVDAAGDVFIPFAGEVRAAGLSIDGLRERIRAALEPLTAAPQVDVRLLEPRSRAVTVQGAVASPGAYVIERGATRLTPILALAGGSTLPPERTEVVVRRAGLSGAVPLSALYADPGLDIALRPNDQVFLNEIQKDFIALGATSAQAEIAFPGPELDLLSAISLAGGLDDFLANPAGIFVFRYERPEIAEALLAGAPPEGLPAGPGRPIVYRLDLSEPEGFFAAREFAMRDEDAIYVANAPLTELRKFVSLFTAAASPVRTTGSLAAGGLVR